MPTITKRGARWQAKVRRRGQPQLSRTFTSKRDAEIWARALEAQADRGALPPDLREAGRTTVGEALDRYAREVSAAKKGAKQEAWRIAWLKRQPIARRTLANTRGADVAELRNAMTSQGLAANTTRLALALLSHLWTTARTEWRMEGLANPVQSIRKPSTTGTARDRRLAHGEQALLVNAAQDGPRWLAPAIALAIETAARRGELARLTWADVDLEGAQARLRDTKNGRSRTIPLTPAAQRALEALPRSERGRILPIAPDQLTKQFQAACRRAGLEGLRFHDLRHEATSRLFEAGLSIVEVAAVTGHETLQMLKRYTHPRTADIAAKLAANRRAPPAAAPQSTGRPRSTARPSAGPRAETASECSANAGRPLRAATPR
jgi:integrase